MAGCNIGKRIAGDRADRFAVHLHICYRIAGCRGNGEGLVFALALKKAETQPGRFYGHSTETDWTYTHYRDLEGNHWFGWNEDRKFHWVLSKHGRLWWRGVRRIV